MNRCRAVLTASLAALLLGCDASVTSGGKPFDDALQFRADGTAYDPYTGDEVDLTKPEHRVPYNSKKGTESSEPFRIVGQEVLCSDCGGSGMSILSAGTGHGGVVQEDRDPSGKCLLCGGDGFILMGDIDPPPPRW